MNDSDPIFAVLEAHWSARRELSLACERAAPLEDETSIVCAMRKTQLWHT
jgi:hypothetical protein